MSYSDYIYKIEAWLLSINVQVSYIPSFETDLVAGRHHDDPPKVEILSSLDAKQALLAIAHEAGHHIGYVLHRRIESYKREQVYAYGWRVLRLARAPISRAEWLAECREASALHL